MDIPLNEVEMHLTETTLTVDADVRSGDATLAAESKKAQKGINARSRRELERYMEEKALARELESLY